MSVKINKNNKEYPIGVIPEHYPADRVYLDGDTSKTVQDAIDELKSLPSSVRAWSGNTLKFSIPQSNAVIYKFIAMNNAGNLVEACFINRADGLKVAHTSSLTMSATYANGELTVTLPSTSYWVYSLTVIESKY